MDWRGVVPLHSSRHNVETLLGRSASSEKYLSSYEFESGFAEIMYASGPPCGATMVDIWRVPSDTVVNIRVIPKNKLELSAVLEDNRGYVKTFDPKEKEISFYTSEEKGIRYTVHSAEQGSQPYVVSTDYLPSLSENSKKCSDFSTPHDWIQAMPAFERYGRISLSMEKAIL